MDQAMNRKKVVIAGGGTAGWMTAAAMGKVLEKACDITLVESDAIGTVGVGEATIPTLVTYNRLIGLDEAKWMSAVRGTFKLGIAFENWTELNHRYIHSFGITGKDHWTAGFQHFWHRGRELGVAGEFGDYCLELVAAEQERFAHLPDLGLNYAYHIDATAYAGFLRELAEQHGVRRTEGRINEVRRNERGDLESLVLDDGSVIQGDLFIDCTGFRALLIEGALGVGYDDWTHWLPCDRAIAVQTESVRPPRPYTRSIAHKAGWRWQIPLQHRTGNGHVYWNEYISDDEATHQLMSTLEGPALAEPKQLFFKTGRRRKFWNRNVVSIGLAAGFLEPLESTSIHLIQEGITALIELFPTDRVDPLDADEYNERMGLNFERVRDFLLLHYVATQRGDSPMWRHFRHLKLPGSLQERIEAWLTRGYVLKYEFGVFLPPSWIAVMLGQNLVPEHHDPRVGRYSIADINGMLERVRLDTEAAVAATPTQAAFLTQYGAASGSSLRAARA